MRHSASDVAHLPTRRLSTVIVALTLALASLAPASAAHAQSWHPAPGHTQLALWPRGVPDSQPARARETVTTTNARQLVAGRRWTYIENVSVPTITVYSPNARLNTHVAMLVFPGGGYQ